MTMKPEGVGGSNDGGDGDNVWRSGGGVDSAPSTTARQPLTSRLPLKKGSRRMDMSGTTTASHSPAVCP